MHQGQKSSGETIAYELRRSGRRSVSVEIRRDGTVLVRAPQNMSGKDIERFVEKHAEWIDRHRRKILESRAGEGDALPVLTQEELRRLAESAGEEIPDRVAFYARVMGVTYGRITIRHQKTRWGSCSAKGNLNFNCVLMLMPGEILDYVIVHELAHRKEMNHSAAFWKIVESVLPDYRRRRKWLRENGYKYMS